MRFEGSRNMSKNIILKCKNCGSVIYNLPEKEFRTLKTVDLICDDCIKKNKEKEGLENKVNYYVEILLNTQG